MIKSVPKFLIVFIAFIVISGVSAYVTLMIFIQTEETLVVPNLIGEDIVYVLEIMTDLGLNTKVKGSEYDQDIAKNSIIYQEPRPGEVIKKGRDIRVIISKGAKNVLMPNLKGMNIQQARLILEKNGMKEGVASSVYHEHIERNFIISQYPFSGENISRETKPDLLISLGKKPLEILMPDLKGLYLADAVIAVEKNKLVIGTIKPVYNENKPANIITSQSIACGYLVLENQKVDIEVNRQPGTQPVAGKGKLFNGKLFKYRLSEGFLKQHIRIELRAFHETIVIYDQLMPPGKELWIYVPGSSASVIFLYKNGELLESRMFD